MKNATFTAFVGYDFYEAGKSCDGHPYIASKFYVMVENEAGRRFRHTASFPSVQVQEWEGENIFVNIGEESKDIADSLAKKVNAALQASKQLDQNYWFEIDPAYGSDEYIAQDTESQRLFAEKQEG
jgi:hypothetical protein